MNGWLAQCSVHQCPHEIHIKGCESPLSENMWQSIGAGHGEIFKSLKSGFATCMPQCFVSNCLGPVFRVTAWSPPLPVALATFVHRDMGIPNSESATLAKALARTGSTSTHIASYELLHTTMS